MSLLFDGAARPAAQVLRDLAASSGAFSISHDPGEYSDWLELLVNGLTFDLKGLAPGEGLEPALFAHRFDLDSTFPFSRMQAVTLRPGPHLVGVEAMPPVVRSQMWLALQLCALHGLRAVGWLPGRTLSSVEHFHLLVTAWLEGGPFPGLCLTALASVPDGGMQSEGLAFFIGQEVRIEPELAADKAWAARLALRLIHELVELGPVGGGQEFTGPDGEALRIEPSGNGRFVRVRQG